MSIGQLKNLSRSGALILNGEVQLFSLIHVALGSHQEPTLDEETIAAYVTRVGDDGIGVEWCEFAPPAVTALLQAAIASSGAHKERQIEPVLPEVPDTAPLLNYAS
jgi:hypothetical protein